MNSSPFQKSELKELRANYPHIKNGLTYLNHAAISPLSSTVKKAIESFIMERHQGPIENFEQGVQRAEEAKSAIQRYISAESTDRITFLDNTSNAISAVAGGFPWQNGDEIITNTMEFPSNVQPFRILEKRGVKTVYVPHRNYTITAEMIKEFITPKTKMVAVSAVQYLSGYKADLKAIGELCEAHNITFVVDGIQALGAQQVDVQKCHIDALASGGHKWLMGPMGQGFLYLSQSLSKNLEPVQTGWLSVKEPWELSNFEQDWQPVNQHLETGTPNMLGITGLGASLQSKFDIGPEKIQQQILYLTGQLIENLQSRKGVSLITPKNAKNRLGIVTFTVEGVQREEYDEVVSELIKSGITISTREGFFRISPHYYNSDTDIDKAVNEIFKRL